MSDPLWATLVRETLGIIGKIVEFEGAALLIFERRVFIEN